MKIIRIIDIILSGLFGVFVALAFSLSFRAKMVVTNSGNTGAFKNIIWGCKTFTDNSGNHPISYTGLSMNEVGPSTIPLIGLILILVGAVSFVLVFAIVKKSFAKFICVGFAAVILAGSIMLFFTHDSFIRALSVAEAHANHRYDDASIDKIYSYLKHLHAKTINVNICGIFGIIGALCGGVAVFLPKKK